MKKTVDVRLVYTLESKLESDTCWKNGATRELRPRLTSASLTFWSFIFSNKPPGTLHSEWLYSEKQDQTYWVSSRWSDPLMSLSKYLSSILPRLTQSQDKKIVWICIDSKWNENFPDGSSSWASSESNRCAVQVRILAKVVVEFSTYRRNFNVKEFSGANQIKVPSNLYLLCSFSSVQNHFR